MKPLNKLLLTLIIPTRERAETLAFTLATALDQVSLDYEVIVSDNASEDDTRVVVERCSDSRVRYFNTGHRLSMCDNYEFALKLAVGKYVIIIGDDDAVMPGALDKLMARMRIDPEPIIYMWPLHTYDWPVGNQPASVAYLAPARPQTEVDLKRKAKFVISMGGWKYYELPSPYHCAIPKKILDEIRVRTGRVFHSTQPDVFTAMAIPALVDKALDIGYTVTLNGRSARSNGLGFVTKNAFPNIQRFIREYNDYHFHSTLYEDAPEIVNMIPDAILVAKDIFLDFYKGQQFNYDAMWAYLCRLRFISHAEVLQKRMKIRRYHEFYPLQFLFFSLIQEISVLRRNFLNRIMSFKGFRKHVPGNIQDFVKTLTEISSNSGFHLNKKLTKK